MNRFTTLLLVVTACSLCLAQRGSRRNREPVEPGPQILLDRRGVPDWPLDEEFPEDVFTFVRVMYNPYGGGGWGKWRTDYPDSDLNFSFRLQQLTSLKVNPNPIVLEPADPRIFDYPFLYIIEPGNGMGLTPEEAENLRRYCFNGGFIMVDDFWGEDEWYYFYLDLKKVFPDREPVDLTLEHPVFHCVYDLTEMPQVPSIGHALSGQTTERWDAPHANYRAVYDDNDRMVMLICHNTDLGDGWEREGENVDYFHQYSEKWAYPMGINIVFYAMTH
jgi:hypothetical protein